MALGSYLRLRGGTYYCRLRVPRRLRSALDRGEIVISLRTGRFAAATRAARAIRAGLDKIMTEVERGLAPIDIEKRVRAWVAELVFEYGTHLGAHDGLSGLFDAEEASNMGPDQATEVDRLMRFVIINETEAAKKALVEAVSGIALKTESVDSLVAAAAASTNLHFEPNSIEAKLLRSSVLRNLQVLIDASNSLAKGMPMSDRMLGWMQQPTAPASEFAKTPRLTSDEKSDPENYGKSFSELWDEFSADKVYNKEWKLNEPHSAKTTLSLWLRINGDHPLHEYKNTDVKKFQRVYRNLPSDYYHNKIWKKIYENEGPVALAEATKPKEEILTSEKTWNKHLSRIGEYWKWAMTKGNALPKGTPSICDGFFIHIDKNRIGTKIKEALREKFDDAQITTILNAPLFLGCKSRSRWKQKGNLVFRNHRYWMVLLDVLTESNNLGDSGIQQGANRFRV